MGTSLGGKVACVSIPGKAEHRKRFAAVGQEVAGDWHSSSLSHGRGEKGSRLQP